MSGRYPPVLAVALMVALLIGANPLAMQASSDGEDWTGIITARPSGTIGEWVIGGRVFLANAATRMDQEHGPPAVGACAEVEYYTVGSSNIATKIDTEELYKCSGGGGGEGGGRLDRYARVEAFPTTLVGSWTIGGVDYTATSATRFEQKYGTFAIGGCVEVTFTTNGSTHTALKLETEQAHKCDRNDGSPIGRSQLYGILGTFPAGMIGDWEIGGTIYRANTDTRFEQEHGSFFRGGCVDLKFQADTLYALEISSAESYNCGTTGPQPVLQKTYGLVTAIPAGTIGVWTIGGGLYATTSSTQFEAEHGLLAVGSCAKVVYSVSNGENVAVRMGSEELTKCNGGSYHNTIHGLISIMPGDRYGSWTIAGKLFDATPATRFEEEHATLTVGGCAEVSYYVQGGVNYTEAIEAHPIAYCSGGTNPNQPVIAKIYATVDTLPPPPYTGTWVIGGVSYSTTTATLFEQEAAAFGVGGCVEAVYSVTDAGNLLRNVEAKLPHRCQVGNQPVLRVYGVVESLPNPIGAGVWRIGGADYQATSATRFEQEYGFLIAGAYVEVYYQSQAGVLTALAIETHVAPGSGRTTTVGLLESRPDDDTGTWIIDGTAYQGDPAIRVDLSGSGTQARLTTTDRVVINSYRGTDGVAYLTSIVTVHSQVYIPLVIR